MKVQKKQLKKIWEQTPPDYYQKGIKNNIFQRIWHTNKLSAVLRLIDKNPQNILDVGCAGGWFLSKISAEYPNAKCYGIDVYRKAIIYGQKEYKNIDLSVGDAHKLPFHTSCFDLVLCTEVLEHTLQPDKVIAEIRRVLKNDGIAIIEMDSGNIIFTIIWFLWIHLFGTVWKRAHLHIFNYHKLKKLIQINKLTINEVRVFNFGMAIAFQCSRIK